MNLPKAILLTLAFSLSSAAFAEDGADRVFARMMNAQQAAKQKTEQTVAATDVQSPKNCKNCC